MATVISKKEAKKLGLNKFFTGEPCKNGHLSDRYVSNSDCTECRREYKVKHYQDNKPRYSENSAAYIKNNKEQLSNNSKNYYINNVETIKAKTNQYYHDNKETILHKDRELRNIPKYGTAYPSKTQISQSLQKSINDNFGRDFGNQKHWCDESYIRINCPIWLAYHHKILKESCVEISEKYLPDVHNSTIAHRLSDFGIAISRYTVSGAEKQILQFLEQLDITVVIRNREIIEPYELDMYIPSHNLAIEYCGLYWHNEIHKPTDYHRIKYELCKEKGIRLITIFEDEWLDNRPLVENKLKNILNLSQDEKIFARKCIVKQVPTQEKSVFFKQTHIQGDGPSSINIGLYYKDELVACLGFIKEKNNTYNLSRYSTSKNIVGGFTKLLSYFESIYAPTQIYTFADLRWSEGNLYYKSGFILDKELAPDYSYISGEQRVHKFNLRHKRLSKKLKNYNPELSEHQNCLNNGIYRIYDCGKLKFVKNYE